MASVNKVIIVGNLGKDPEMRSFPNGDQIANVTIATTDKWKDKQTGEAKEATEWHRVAFGGRLAEIVGQYLRKGSQVYVEGSLSPASGPTRTAWTNTPPKSAPTRCRCSAADRAWAARRRRMTAATAAATSPALPPRPAHRPPHRARRPRRRKPPADSTTWMTTSRFRTCRLKTSPHHAGFFTSTRYEFRIC